MSENFLFNAPTYFDFNLHQDNDDTGHVETYFDVDHESTPIINSAIHSKQPTPDCVYSDIIHEFTPCINSKEPADAIKEQHITNNSNLPTSTSLEDLCQQKEVINCGEDKIEIDYDPQSIKLRRSISAGNLIHIDEHLSEIRRQVLDSRSKECGPTRKPNLKDRINILAQPKCIKQAKYVSTAEQIKKFYGTPTRFHTWQRKLETPNQHDKPHSLVIPESPALATKLRIRSNNVLSTDEIEKQQMEEFKKLKIKARPVNQKILHGPIKPFAVPKKEATIIQPFNLSENPRKKAQTSSEKTEKYEFHANPMPKAIYERSAAVTKPEYKHRQGVSFGPKEKLNVQPVKVMSTEKLFKPTPTQPAPFSFETRDQQITKRREALINKVLEEEKQARTFRANPVPKFISKKSASLSTLRTIKSECDSNDIQLVQFKAKPASVLYQKPFEPKKPDRAFVEVTDVCLNTDRRAKEREEFEKKQQERKDRWAIEQQKREIYQAQVEAEEIARLRKETVHTAQPVKHYKELNIQPSRKVTIPVTPNFKTSERIKMHDKENVDDC